MPEPPPQYGPVLVGQRMSAMGPWSGRPVTLLLELPSNIAARWEQLVASSHHPPPAKTNQQRTKWDLTVHSGFKPDVVCTYTCSTHVEGTLLKSRIRVPFRESRGAASQHAAWFTGPGCGRPTSLHLRRLEQGGGNSSPATRPGTSQPGSLSGTWEAKWQKWCKLVVF